MSARVWLSLLVAGALVGAVPTAAGAPDTITVGSKAFTENYILAEIVATFVQDAGEARVGRRLGLGGTGIVYEALARGEIDVYPEYTGTISRVILNDPSLTTVAALRARLQARGLTISEPLGFRNTYALAVRRETAERHGLRTISDLRRHPQFRAAFDPGFFERDDAWPGLRRHYGLALADARIIEHALAHGALASGRVDLIDVFSTDGQLSRVDAVLLEDDRRFFPDYAAVLLARQAVVDRFPRTWAALQRGMVGKIDERAMIRLNAVADVDGRSFADAAAEFRGRGAARAGFSPMAELPRLTVAADSSLCDEPLDGVVKREKVGDSLLR